MRIQSARPLLTAVCTVAVAVSGIAFAALDPQKFVAGWRLDLTSEGAFYDVPLTHEVYQFGRSLNELAVLDANGEPMPFYRVAVPSAAVSEEYSTLGVSPIYVRQGDGAAADLRVTTQGDRTEVVVARPTDKDPESEVVAFIVDAREIEGTPTAIELVWRPLDRPFLMSVSIEHSDDLTRWRTVGRGSIASLAIDGASVTHGKIAITGSERGYYRLKWSRLVSDWQLESVVLATSAVTELATFGQVDLSPIEVPEERASEDALYFDAGGALPTTSIDLVFSDKNRWGNASIYFGNSTDGPWQRLGSRRLFYDIDFEGERLASEPLSLRRVEVRYWKVLFATKTGADDVQLSLEYPEEHLRFAANGEPPYQLVGGTLSNEAGPDTTFAAVMSALDPDKTKVATASLAARTVLGGPAALVIPTEFPWRTVYLWVALLAAVLVIGFMAVRLAREMLVNNK